MTIGFGGFGSADKVRDPVSVDAEDPSATGAAVIGFLTQDSVAEAVASVAESASGFVETLPRLDLPIVQSLLDELIQEKAWISERWLRRPDGAVEMVSDAVFRSADPIERLSSNDCIYNVPAGDRHVHAFLSAVRRNEVSTRLFFGLR